MSGGMEALPAVLLAINAVPFEPPLRMLRSPWAVTETGPAFPAPPKESELI